MANEVQDFQKDVVDRSFTKPVLVDFWAPWCAPCNVLGPVLDRLAQDANGRWELAKVNVDEHQDVAKQYGVKGIPVVKLFADGEVLNEFQGALPEDQISNWLEENLPTEGKKKLQEAKTFIDKEDHESAKMALEEALQHEPALKEAQVLLANEIVMNEPERALELVSTIHEDSSHYQMACDISTLSYLMTVDTEQLEEASVKSYYVQAINSLREARFEEALQHIIEVIRRNKYYDDEGARKGCIAIFHYLGEDHELSKEYRRKFDMALF